MPTRRLFDGAQIELGIIPILAPIAPPAGETNVTWIKISGVWKLSNVWIKVNGVWKQSLPYVNISGTWN